MSVCKATMANIPAVPAASSTWSKTGSESSSLLPNNLWGMENDTAPDVQGEGQVAGAALDIVLSRQKEWPLSHLRTCRLAQ